MSRLAPFLFRAVRRDGSRLDAVFYASKNAKQASEYAKAWATRLGHVRIDLVVEERAA